MDGWTDGLAAEQCRRMDDGLGRMMPDECVGVAWDQHTALGWDESQRLWKLSRSAQLLPACPATDGCGCTTSTSTIGSSSRCSSSTSTTSNMTDKNTNNNNCNVS